MIKNMKMKIPYYITAFFVLFALSPAACAVECGIDAVADIALLEELECGQGDGIRVKEPGISVNCNGFRINGIGEGGGIIVEADNVDILNCHVSNFQNGIYVVDSRNVNINSNTLAENIFGVGVIGSSDISVSNNNISGNIRYGLLSQQSDVTVSGNHFENNGEDVFEIIREDEEEPEQRVDVDEEEVVLPEPEDEEDEGDEGTRQEITDKEMTDEELLNKTIYLEYSVSEIDEDLIDEKLNKLDKTMKNIAVMREVYYDYENNVTRISLTIVPDKTMKDLSVYETIPKCAAQIVDVIVFEREPDIVLESDPLIKWHFSKLNEPVDLSYSINDIISEDCVKLVKTIGVAQKIGVGAAIFVIPLIVIVIIFFSRFAMKRKQKPF